MRTSKANILEKEIEALHLQIEDMKKQLDAARAEIKELKSAPRILSYSRNSYM